MPITIKNFNSTRKSWIWRNQSLWLISISSDWESWITIADKNLGATKIWNAWDVIDNDNCWKVYQWWNNYWWTFTEASNWISITTWTVDATNYWPWNYYSSNVRRKWSWSNHYWDSSFNRNLRWDTTNTNSARQWPCASWFHVPSNSDIVDINNKLDSLWINWWWVNWYLKLPQCVLILWYMDPGSPMYIYLYSWTSTPVDDYTTYKNIKIWYKDSGWLSIASGTPVNLSTIRPFKNEPVIPDNTWTAIYDWEARLITTSWIYHEPWSWIISLSSDWTTWITIADKNLWATTVYNSWDTLSEENCWKFYQRWNNYPFPFTWPATTSNSQINASTYWPWNYYSNYTFRTQVWTTQSWDSSYNQDLWGWTTWTNVAMQWPCPSGYHVPTDTELSNLLTTRTAIDSWSNTPSILKIPLWGYIAVWWTKVSWTWTSFWSSTWAWNNWAYRTYIDNNNRTPHTSYHTSSWFPIRPFKNVSVQPNTNRIALYQPS